jgi:hypothetical protein
VKTADAKPPQKPLKTLILPSNASGDARFVSLENPATGHPVPYYFCPNLGLFEFTLVTAPSPASRSVLFTPVSPTDRTLESDSPKEDGESSPQKPQDEGYISKLAQLHVATPVDMLFFILPILAPSSKRARAQEVFQPLDDILEARENLSATQRYILTHPAVRETLEKRMAAVCDAVEDGDTSFRLSEIKLVKELLSKAEKVAAGGLPASLEERFVRRELELPLLSVRREDSSISDTTEKASQEHPLEASQNGEDSQMSNASCSFAPTTASSTSVASGTQTPLTQPDSQVEVSDDRNAVRRLLRIRTALSFIISSYVPAHLSARIEAVLQSPTSPVDFTPLTEHLKHIAELRAKALESRAMYNMSRKRGLEDEDEAVTSREEKRRKEEEDKKKKAAESRGVRDLKKVNTSGMKKLSAFFGKPAKK